MDTLDYAGPEVNKGSKGVLLGLGDPIRKLPHTISDAPSKNIIRNIKVFCPGCLVVEIPSYQEDAHSIKEIANINEFKDWPLIIAVDDAEKATRTQSSFLWTTFTRFEPAADIHSKDTRLSGNRVIHQGPVVIDARMKPWYPDELFCDPETSKLVTEKWSSYFPGRNVEMGDSDSAHLFS
jgi:3-polyprenyl-4-hydroxybenzoate decarboxylase